MLQFECYDAKADARADANTGAKAESDTGDLGAYSSQIAVASVGASSTGVVGIMGDIPADTSGRSALISAVGTVDRDRGRARAAPVADTGADVDPELDSAAAALRSWVVGWTHRFDPLNARRVAEPNPAGVRRLVEAVVDVLLERRPAEQVKRLVSREVFALLTAVAQRRAAARFAARSMVRSIQLHTPGPDAVESTVLVQDGPRVRAVALRFERISTPVFETTPNYERMNSGTTQGRLEWRCTALQFA